jgi:hypothetical protein
MPGKIAALIFSLLLMTGPGPAGAARFPDTGLPDSIRLEGTDGELILNGGGIREKLFMDIYIGALYLPEKTGSARAILSATGPASVRMHFLYKEVSREKIIDGWHDGLSANLTGPEYTALQPRLEQFNSLFRSMRSGEVISIDYVPGSGTAVRINGKLQGTVPGNDFFRALLKIWLGDRPVSKSLKQGMLGGR